MSTPECRSAQPTKPITPRDLNYTAAMIVVQNMPIKKARHEHDTAFVRRIVCAYLNALPEAEALLARIKQTIER